MLRPKEAFKDYILYRTLQRYEAKGIINHGGTKKIKRRKDRLERL